jgi:hypothetical protein
MRSNGGEKWRKEKFEDFFFRVFRYNKVVYESFKGIIKTHVYLAASCYTHELIKLCHEMRERSDTNLCDNKTNYAFSSCWAIYKIYLVSLMGRMLINGTANNKRINMSIKVLQFRVLSIMKNWFMRF